MVYLPLLIFIFHRVQTKSKQVKFIFWAGLAIEFAALTWFIYQIWLLYSGRSGYLEEAYPDMYRKNLIPAVILFAIISSAMFVRFWFKAPKIATWIVLSPALVMILSMLGMVVASMFIRDWR